MGEQTKMTRERGIDRALNILECLHQVRKPLSIGQIAKRLEAPRSTIYEIINRFLAAGILEPYGTEGKVFFGRTVHLYAADYQNANELFRRAREEVDRLADLTGETAEFCTLQGNKYTIVYMKPGGKVFRISSEVGVRLPVPWTASGRLLLSHLGRDEIKDLVPAEDFILPDGTQIDFEELYDDVIRANRDGCAVTSGLVDRFAQCLAAPVRDAGGKPIATLCFVVTADAPTSEVARLLALLMEGARRLSDDRGRENADEPPRDRRLAPLGAAMRG